MSVNKNARLTPRGREILVSRLKRGEHPQDVAATPGPTDFRRQPAVAFISWPQHIGDLILPWSLGHLEICTSVPLSNVRLSLTSGASHLPQVALTLIPHTAHSYVAIL